jgi:hypothetical protein
VPLAVPAAGVISGVVSSVISKSHIERQPAGCRFCVSAKLGESAVGDSPPAVAANCRKSGMPL